MSGRLDNGAKRDLLALAAVKRSASCVSGKVSYPSEARAALRAAPHASQSPVHGPWIAPEPYHCWHCGRWHIGRRRP
jgi:hypothetical protein